MKRNEKICDQQFGVDENRVEIWGSGKTMREFLWSEDMADACVFIMENRDFKDTYEVTDGSNTTCTPNEVKNKEIRNTHVNIGTGVGIKGELYFNVDKPDVTMKKLTDVSKLYGLGWKHKIESTEGIEKMYHWYKEIKD